MPRVSVEILPWLNCVVDPDHQGRLLVDLEVQGYRLQDLFGAIALRYPNFREIYDPDNHDMVEMVEVVLNGKMVPFAGLLETRLEEDDTIALLPAFVGG